MKPTKLVIKNIGKLAGEKVINIDKPLILFYGEIKQGKTTILNSVRWVCGGEFPADIISHGEKEGEIELHFDGGMIARSFYRAKDGSTKARAVTFVKNGRPVPSPVSEIKRLLNPFLLDQDFLRNKTELERKQYFTELFAVDTTELDTELFNNQRDATTLRAKIAGYGEIDLTKVEAVDAESIKRKINLLGDEYKAVKLEIETEMHELTLAHQRKCEDIDDANDKIREHNTAVDGRFEKANSLKGEIERLEARLLAVKKEMDAIVIGDKKSLLPKPTAPDLAAYQKRIVAACPNTDALTKQLQEAGAINVRAEQYQSNKKRAEAKQEDSTNLAALEKRGREIKAEKQAKLKSIGETCGIAGLEFDEAGNFIYDGTTAGMISDSQIMRLSSELSALYPDGFGIDLIDRAESLGKSIFEFVDKAKAENKSILATIVGERPATVPENVGVFVVENGKLTTGELI